MTRPSISKVGVYADVANMYRNGGQRMQYDILREFAARDLAEPMRLNAYVTYDSDRAKRDPSYRSGTTSFHSKLRDYGYKVIVKEITWYRDDSGNRYGKADADLDLAVRVGADAGIGQRAHGLLDLLERLHRRGARRFDGDGSERGGHHAGDEQAGHGVLADF